MHQVKNEVNFALLSLVDGTLEPLLWDTSVQGTPPQNLVLKNTSNLCICYLCSWDTSIQGKGTLFLGPKTQIQPPFRGHLSNQKVTDHKNR